MVELVDSPESWPVVETADLHRDQWVVALRADTIRHPDDPTGEDGDFRRIVLEHPGAAIVLAVDDDQQVVLLRQYRHASQKRFVEVPAGLIDHPGEDPLDVARRELVEEVGLEAARWTHLTSAHPSPGISSEVQHLFLAQGLSEVGRGSFEVEHEEADMEVFRAPWSEVLAAVLAGDIGDLPMVAAVLLAHARGLVEPVGADE
jgi:ADP-ribose pyrophosphatase